MSVVLYYYFGMFCLYHCHEAAQHGGLSYSGHVFKAYFGCALGYELVGYLAVIFGRVYGRRCYAERGLRSHSGVESVVDARDYVAHIVKAAEYAGDVNALCVFYVVHELAHVGRHGEHAQCVQAAVEHVCLYSYFVERFGESTHRLVRVLAVKEVDLLEGTAVGLYTCKAPHSYNRGSNALELVFARLVFARRLKHVPVYETELNFLFHILNVSYLCQYVLSLLLNPHILNPRNGRLCLRVLHIIAV